MSERTLNIRDVSIIVAVVTLIIIVALLTKSFWGDELFSLRFSSGSWSALIDELSSDYHPPLYFVLLKLWITIGGNGETWLRIFQGLQGVALLSLLLILFRSFLPQRRYHPVFFLLLVSPAFWLYMPMLRYYSLAAALAVACTIVWMRWVEVPNRRDSLQLCILAAALLYTDYPTAMLLPILAIWTLWKRRDVFLRLLGIMTLSGVMFLPWAGIVVKQLGLLQSSGSEADLNAHPMALVLKITYSLYAFLIGETVYPVEAVAVLVGVILASIALPVVWKRRARILRSDAVLPLFIVLGGLLCTALISTFISRHTSFIYTPARTFYALGFVFIAIGMLYEQLGNTRTRVLLLCSVAGISLYGVYNYSANRHFFMPVYAIPWKEVVRELHDVDGVIVSDESDCYRYYAERENASLPELLPPEEAMERIREFSDNDRTVDVAVINTERESTTGEIPPELLALLDARAELLRKRMYVPYDDTYKWMKQSLLRRDPGEGKLHLSLYRLHEP